ncbi:MAG TPA: MFS transporter, partial [Spongiibacteraceae bacterium]|nr:MFS transporter [Spongiibacteraceae bacterium]
MYTQLLAISTLIVSILLLITGNAFLMTLLGVRLSLEGIAPALIGSVLVCYSFGFVIGTLLANRIILRVGHIRTFAAFSAVAACAALSYPLWVNPLWWALLRGLSGIAMATLLVVVESWFSSRATNANRATLFAIYLITFYLATAGGQLLINAGDPQSYKLFSIVALLLTLALIPLALTRLPAPALEHVQHLPLLQLYQETPLAFTASLLSGIVISAFYAMAPIYAHLTERTLEELSIFMAAAVLSAMLCAWPIGKLCDRYERRNVLMWVALGAAIASITTGLAGALSLPLLIMGSAAFMGLAAAIYPIAVAIVNDRIDSHYIVAASGALLLAYGIGSCIGPLLSSLLLSIIGAAGLFVGNAFVLIALALLSRYWIQHREPLPLDAQEHYVPTVPASTPVITEIDPRNEAFTGETTE